MNLPKVSCITPTYNRRRFLPQAIRHFQRQDYPDRELLVLDDGTDPVADLIPDDPHIRYFRLPERRTIGAKRNLGCALARGEIIAHWDDDDWMSADRLTRQITEFVRSDVDVVGLRALNYVELPSARCWRYEYSAELRPWVLESTFVYRREFAVTHPFPDLMVAEGTHWLWQTPNLRVRAHADSSFYVGVIHPENVSPKNTASHWWRSVPPREVADVLGDDWALLTQPQ
ncbi:glycosyltransferase family 2 protein [Amycolatopsis sp. NPDC054798]